MENIKEIYNDIITWFVVKYETIDRIIFYGWNGRNSYDFDAHFLYHSIYIKLDRVYDTMLNHSHCGWNGSEHTNLMRKLNTMRLLARRLFEDDYFQNELIPHKNKWGEHTFDFIKIGGTRSQYENANTEKELEQANKEFLRCHDNGNKQSILERKELFRLLEKYINVLWD